MISGLQPGAIRQAVSADAATARIVPGNPLPSPGGDRPVEAPAAVAVPDRTRSAEVLNRYLAGAQRSLRFLHDPDARRTIILVVDPGSGEVLRQIPPEEMLAIARRIAEPRLSVIDLRA
jgi:flagellar protein FlaG